MPCPNQRPASTHIVTASNGTWTFQFARFNNWPPRRRPAQNPTDPVVRTLEIRGSNLAKKNAETGLDGDTIGFMEEIRDVLKKYDESYISTSLHSVSEINKF